MSAGRLLLALLLVSGGLAASVVFTSKAIDSLRESHYHDQIFGPTSQPRSAKTTTDKARRRQRASGTRRYRPDTSKPRTAKAKGNDGGEVFGLSSRSVLRIAGLETAGGLVLVGLLVAGLTVRRVRMRRRRAYELYELHLSMHDEAKPQDLEDMVEAIANIVRAWPADRVRHGQPHLAVELIYGTGPSGMEWSINLRCQPQIATALDAAISAAYPDVRLGRTHADRPVPRTGALREPGHVLRFRKERAFVYPLIAPDEALASPPLEQIAAAQIGAGEPSVVRFQLTPTPSFFEELARRLYRRQENRLVRQERWGLPEGGLWSTLNRAEMRNAQRTQNRSLFWLEIQVAADRACVCKAIASAVQSRRGENRLHRRWMTVRQRLYRRRFPRALGPLLPSPRCLVSAAEVAHLLALPSARMKSVPVRRLAVPRIPAPPEARRTTDERLWWPGSPNPTAAAPTRPRALR
jgi:hypothetical protein